MPISYNGKHYIRTGSTTQELHDKELNKFLLDKSGMSWDDMVEELATLEDIDPDTIVRFKDLAKGRLPAIVNETGVKEILNKLRLLNGDKPKRAAILLFGRDPQRFYTTAYVKIGKFATATDVIGDDNVEGNLFEQVDAIMTSLKTKYLMANIRYEGIIRKDDLEYPEPALREALINAIIHKDYTGAHVQLKIFPEKAVFWNEGKLMEGLNINSLKGNHPSVPRNELLAKVFYYAGFIETWGRGTIKIIESCKNAGLPEPVFREAFGGIELTIIKNLYTQEYLENIGLNDRQVKAVFYVKDKGSITNQEFQKIGNASMQTITNDLKILVNKGIFIRTGSDVGVGTSYVLGDTTIDQ